MSCSFRKDDLVEICRSDGKRIRTGLRQYPTVATKQKKKATPSPYISNPIVLLNAVNMPRLPKNPNKCRAKKLDLLSISRGLSSLRASNGLKDGLTQRTSRSEILLVLRSPATTTFPQVFRLQVPQRRQPAAHKKKITDIVPKVSRAVPPAPPPRLKTYGAVPPVPPPRPKTTLRMMSTLNTMPEYASITGIANSKLAFSGDMPTDMLQLPNMQTEIGYSFDVERKVLEDSKKLQQAEATSVTRAKKYAEFGDEYAEFAKILKLV